MKNQLPNLIWHKNLYKRGHFSKDPINLDLLYGLWWKKSVWDHVAPTKEKPNRGFLKVLMFLHWNSEIEY